MGEKKKVIFIMTDTQRKDMVGCYGNKEMKTPHLDRLASEGIRYDKAYTCQPVCGPARSALFTGTYPHSNGSWGNTMPMGDNVKTVGQRLHDKGVNTAYIGKWHLDGGDYFGTGECPEGWDSDYWYDMKNYLDELSEKDRVRSRDPFTNHDPEVTEDFTFGHRCSDRAIKYLKENQEDDFLLVVSYDEPHHPFICPEPYATMHKDTAIPKSPNIFDDLKEKPEHHRAWAWNGAKPPTSEELEALELKNPWYLGCNSYVDYEIGRVIDAIDEFAEDALVIYTSDHGEFFRSHGMGNKGAAMYDEITNIPFLVRWKGQVAQGQSSENLVSHINVTPTIMDFFDMLPSKDKCNILEGKSMLPMFKDQNDPSDKEIFIEFGRYEIDHDGFGGFQPIRSILDGQYKLVINLLATDELYDMKTDSAEMNNLIEKPEMAEIRDRLHDRLLQWMNETRDPFRGYYWERRPWRKNPRPATWDYTGNTRQRIEDDYESRQLDYANGLPITSAVRTKEV